MINRIQNKSFCFHNIYVYTAYILKIYKKYVCVFINT